MIQLKEMTEYEIEDMKVFKTDEIQWVAAPTLLHALFFLEEQIGELDLSQIQDIEESNIKTEGMWDSDSVSEKEEQDFKNGKIEIIDAKAADFGDYGTFAGMLCKYTSFAEVIKREGVGIYIIACTEY